MGYTIHRSTCEEHTRDVPATNVGPHQSPELVVETEARFLFHVNHMKAITEYTGMFSYAEVFLVLKQ